MLRFSRLLCMAIPTLVLLLGCGPSGGSNGSNFQLGDLVPPFDVPSLEELEQKVAESGGWIDMPVVDSLELLRQRQASETPLATVEEALALRNNSPKENDTILSALGRLPTDAADVNWEASLTRHSLQSFRNANPVLLSTSTEFEVAGLINTGLFSFDWNFEPFAASEMVKSWQSSRDGLYDKVIMRDDITWSDGRPITAHDLEFSYLVIMSEAVPVPAVRSGTDKLKYVKAYDDHTLVYFHQQPLATNVWNVNFPILPKHVYEESIYKDPTLTDSDYHRDCEENPVTGGAYVIKSRTPNEVVLERRDSYFMHNGKQVRDQPHFKTIRLNITPDSSVALIGLKAGDIEEMMIEAPQWESQTNDSEFYQRNTKVYALEWTNFSFQWNTKSPFFSDRRVRWAMSYAFDHEEMINTYRYGRDQPCTGTFHSTSKWFPGNDNAIGMIPEPLKRDPAEAVRLLEEAGWTDTDGDGFRDKLIDGRRVKFEFNILTRDQKERIDLCELLRQNLRPLGVACNVRPIESATLQQKTLDKEFDAVFGGWGTGTDPDTSENIWGSKETRNFVTYQNPMVDELFAEGRKLDQDRRPWKELLLWQDKEVREYLKIDPKLADEPPARPDCYAAIHALLWRDQPYTWLYYRNAYYAFNKKLRGYNFSPRGPYSYGPGFSAIWSPASL